MQIVFESRMLTPGICRSRLSGNPKDHECDRLVFCKRFFPKVADLFPQYCMSVFLIIAYVSRPRRGRGNRTTCRHGVTRLCCSKSDVGRV